MHLNLKIVIKVAPKTPQPVQCHVRRHDIIDSCLVEVSAFKSIALPILRRFIIMGAIIDTLEKKAEVKVPSSLLSLWMA